MSTYIGYYRVTEGFAEESAKRARSGDTSIDPKFAQMVTELPGKLPKGISIIGSYAPMAGGPVLGSAPPSVIIVDATETSELTFISQYYGGYLLFQWHPATVVGASRAQRETWRAQAEAPTPAR